MIDNSSVYTLSGYLRDMGAEPRNAGVVEDDPDAIAARINAALTASDMVIYDGARRWAIMTGR
jgi:molybdopterin biosynthesis enzyme